MGFGGLCPLPFRLGGGPLDGWTAAQFMRAMSDLAAVNNTSDYAILVYNWTGTDIVVYSYRCRAGSGVDFAPTAVASDGIGTVVWTFPRCDAAGNPTNIISVQPSVEGLGSDTIDVTCTERTITVQTAAGGSTPQILAKRTALLIAAKQPERRIQHYGCSPDKEDSRYEGETPYAASHLDSLTSGERAKYLDLTPGTDAHDECLVTARAIAAVSRAAEKLSANSLPSTAHETLGRWAKLQCVRVSEDSLADDIRDVCAMRFASAGSSNTPVDLEALARRLLGDRLVAVHRDRGTDLATPPLQYWPAGTAGPDDIDLGEGPFTSHRAVLSLELDWPSTMPLSELVRIGDSAVQELRRAGPSYLIFQWFVASPFLIDVSRLGVDAL